MRDHCIPTTASIAARRGGGYFRGGVILVSPVPAPASRAPCGIVLGHLVRPGICNNLEFKGRRHGAVSREGAATRRRATSYRPDRIASFVPFSQNGLKVLLKGLKVLSKGLNALLPILGVRTSPMS